MENIVKKAVDIIKQQLNDVFLFGAEDLIEYISIAYFAKGHVLVEGPPGTAKTLCAKLMAKVLSKDFKRIQFTSDMLPGDIIGAHIFSPANQQFEFIKGPLFADFILADEINRTPPRTQSALLEAMEERQVSTEGKVFNLSPDFFVLATQNPRDFEGTFPLPEAQLDRFLFKINTNHAGSEVENDILDRISKGILPPDESQIRSINIPWVQVQQEIESVRVDQSVISYITSILEQSRYSKLISEGSSIRGGISMIKTSRIRALLDDRDYVIPDDIKKLAIPTLRHRIRLSSDAVISEISEVKVLEEIIDKVPFPK